MPIRLLCMSDIHSKVSTLNAILNKAAEDKKKRPDFITISGDISDFGDGEEVKMVLKAIDGTGIPYCYVLGNCDPIESRMGVDVKGKCLESGCMLFAGVAFFGSGGSTRTPFSTLFEVDEDELIANIKRSMSACCGDGGFPGASIMVVHNPPAGEVVDKTRSDLHVGSQKLRQLILEASPILVHCGHIHEAVGVERIGHSVVFNPGPAARGSYVVVEIDMETEGEGGPLVNVSHQKV